SSKGRRHGQVTVDLIQSVYPSPAAVWSALGTHSRPANRRRADFEPVEQVGRGPGHRVNSCVECLGVVPRRRAEPADLAHVLQGGGAHVFLSDLLGVRLAQGLDASAHAPNLAQPTTILVA